jgi:hypothetical protein
MTTAIKPIIVYQYPFHIGPQPGFFFVFKPVTQRRDCAFGEVLKPLRIDDVFYRKRVTLLSPASCKNFATPPNFIFG